MQHTPKNPKRGRFALAAILALALALLPWASADHVEPEVVPGPTNHTCSDFADEGETWKELKVDPPSDGEHTDGELTVTLDVDEAGKRFDWTADLPVGMVFVKAGQAGHHLYVYDPAEQADTGLTTPGEGDRNQISHISFCYMVDEDGEPTCEDNPDMPECQPTCEDNPDMPECQQTCEDNPDMPECQQETCPATVAAIANNDGTVTVTVTADGAFDLYRRTGGDEAELVGQFEGDTTYEDTNTTAGNSYTYTVMVGDETCDEVTVTAIPFFPTALGTIAAAGIGLLGYALVRRRM